MTAPDRSTDAPVTLRALFTTFQEIGLSGFGGALPWARRILVERRGWMTDREFAELLGLCQVLPGGNVINVSIYVGARHHGPLGALVAFSGLMLAPLLLVIGLGILYGYGAQFEAVQTGLRGVAMVAVGFLISAALKIARPYRREPLALAMAALAFVAVGLLRLPLVPVLLVLAPLSIALNWLWAR